MGYSLNEFASFYIQDSDFRASFLVNPESTLRYYFPEIENKEVEYIIDLLNESWVDVQYEYDDKFVLCSSAGY